MFFLFIPAFAQDVDNEYSNISRKIVQAALKDQKGYQYLKELCSQGYRLSGYPGSYAAVDWSVAQLDSLGCDRIWLHSVMVPYWKRGDTEEAFFLRTEDNQQNSLAIAALGGSIGTPDQGITAEVLEVHSFEELHEKAEKAQGRIIFYSGTV